MGGGVVGNFEMLGFVGMGKVEYGPYTSDTPKLPEFRRAIVDPLDVYPGDNQTFTAHVYSPYDIASVTTTTQLDNSTLNLDLEKIDEYVENEQIIEVFSVTWSVHDTHVNIYRTTIIAADTEGNENNITLTWTDPCTGITHGQDSILDSDCTVGVNMVEGLDGGSLTINSGRTLTLNSGSTWAFNSGKTITVNGQICVHGCGGSIKKSNLYMRDEDIDGFGLPSVILWEILPYDSHNLWLGEKTCSQGTIRA